MDGIHPYALILYDTLRSKIFSTLPDHIAIRSSLRQHSDPQPSVTTPDTDSGQGTGGGIPRVLLTLLHLGFSPSIPSVTGSEGAEDLPG